MTKTINIIFFLIVFSYSGLSQSIAALKIGAGISNIVFKDIQDDYFQQSGLPGFSWSIGGSYSKKLKKNISLSAGITVHQMKGTEYFESTTIEGQELVSASHKYEFINRMTYISIPLSLSYSIKKIQLSIGMQAGYIIESKTLFKEEVIYKSQSLYSDEFEIKYYDDLEKFNYGPMIEISYEINRLTLGGHYFLGLSNIYSGRYSLFNEPYDWRTSQLQLQIGYLILNTYEEQ